MRWGTARGRSRSSPAVGRLYADRRAKRGSDEFNGRERFDRANEAGLPNERCLDKRRALARPPPVMHGFQAGGDGPVHLPGQRSWPVSGPTTWVRVHQATGRTGRPTHRLVHPKFFLHHWSGHAGPWSVPIESVEALGLAEASMVPGLSHCRVDADGVAAEWVEATVATRGQPTLVYFPAGGYGPDVLEQNRPVAGTLAVVSDARVLVVACRQAAGLAHSAAIERGIAVYRWLLREGSDLETTTFVGDSGDSSLVRALLAEARNRRLPLPAGGVWFAPRGVTAWRTFSDTRRHRCAGGQSRSAD